MDSLAINRSLCSLKSVLFFLLLCVGVCFLGFSVKPHTPCGLSSWSSFPGEACRHAVMGYAFRDVRKRER